MITDKRYDVRLFLEGHSCPVLSINCSTAFDTSAQIEVLATKEVRALKPSTLVVVGYKDSRGQGPARSGVPASGYSVMFVGMLTSLQLSRGSTQRTASLACIGHAKLLQRFYTFIADIAGGEDGFDRTQAFVGAAAFLRGEMGATGMSAAVLAAFNDSTSPQTPGLSDLTGPARGAIKLLEACLGVIKLSGNPSGQGAQNEYFVHALAHTRFLFQIGAISMDDSVSALLGQNVVNAGLANQAAQHKMTVTMRTVLDMVMRELYYSFYPVCTPHAVLATDLGANLRASTQSEAYSTLTGSFDTILADHVTLFDALDMFVDITGDLRSIDAYRGELASLLRQVPPALLDQTLLFISDNLQEYVQADLAEAHNATTLGDTLDAVARRVSSDIAQAGTTQSITRVLNYLLLPDLSFCTPPACNVLFPNQVFSISTQLALYDRPTRLMLHASAVQGANAAAQQAYYAPSVPEFSSQQGAAGKADTYTPLLPHEIHTGIVPAFQSFTFLEKLATSQTIKNKDEALIRIANFNLMRQRYEPNSISVSGVFNPFACPGFPIAVIDPDDVSDTPTVYIGLLKSVAHSYAGSGQAMTSYTITHARDAREVDELFSGATTASLQGVPAPATSSTYVQLSSSDSDAVDTARTAIVNALARISEGVSSDDVLRVGYAQATLDVAAREVPFTIGGVRQPLPFVGLLAAAATDFQTQIGAPDPITHIRLDICEIGDVDVADAHADLLIDTRIEAITRLRERLTSAGSTTLDFYSAYIEVMLRDFAGQRISEGEASKRNIGGVTAQNLLDAQIPEADDLTVLDLLPFDFEKMRDQVETNAVDIAGGAVRLGITSAIGLSKGTQARALAQNVVQEELYRPSWYSTSFSSVRIGREVYRDIIGVGSVQDKAVNATKNHVVPINGVNQPVVSTYDAIIAAYRDYASSQNKAAFVRRYINRPIADINDIFGQDGLMTARIVPPSVVIPGASCGPISTSESSTATTTYSTQAIIDEKNNAALAYITSTRKEAFR